MNYPFILKFSSITNLTDARYAAGMWADFVGFCFNPASANYIEPQKAKEINAWINGPTLVGEFGNQPIDWVADFVKEFQLKVVQLPSDYSDIKALDLDVKIILDVLDPSESMPLLSNADLILVHSIDDYQNMKSLTDLPILISVFEGMDCNEFDGIEFIGENETEIGIRDHEKWNLLLEPYTN
jgi:hypothetical protein